MKWGKTPLHKNFILRRERPLYFLCNVETINKSLISNSPLKVEFSYRCVLFANCCCCCRHRVSAFSVISSPRKSFSITHSILCLARNIKSKFTLIYRPADLFRRVEPSDSQPLFSLLIFSYKQKKKRGERRQLSTSICLSLSSNSICTGP